MLSLKFVLLAVLAAPAALAQQWTAPTPEELSMTAIPEVPGAPALYLYKEENQDDLIRTISYYVRVKVLTEGGKDYGTVTLPPIARHSELGCANVVGRTIHPDGSVTPFAGKPYKKLKMTAGGHNVYEVVFSMPAVEVGSILEYRYSVPNFSFYSPTWLVQSELFTRKAHYAWRVTQESLSLGGKINLAAITWVPYLPPGVAVKQGISGPSNTYDLVVNNIKPQIQESYMPPVESMSYRVLFYYTYTKTQDEYWTMAGRRWSDERNKFMHIGIAAGAQVRAMLQPLDTDEAITRKIYAYIGTLDNTAYSRDHTVEEDRAEGFNKDITSVDDIVKRKRGTPNQLAALFVTMVRIAGGQAYLMGVADRSEHLFQAGYWSTDQIDDFIAVVPLDGKDIFLDPGEPLCPFGHLAWNHALTTGVRQVEGGGTALLATPGEAYKDERITRVADLALDSQGQAAGTVTVTYVGDPALHWRQQALRGDDTSLKKDLRKQLENVLPAGMEVHVTAVENLTASAQPLKVTYEVKGPVGSQTGKRLLVPANLFASTHLSSFPAGKRVTPVDLHYAEFRQDAMRFKLPAGFAIESSPREARELYRNYASYNSSSKVDADSVTFYRNLVNARVVYGSDEYPELKAFYNEAEATDHQSLVLIRTETHAAAQPAH